MAKNKHFITEYPDILEEWDYDKNASRPDDVPIGSNKKFWWRCEADHSWEASPNNRIANNSGCPYCSNRKILKGFNDLKTCHPELAAEWDFEKNDRNIDEVMNNSRYKAHWKCEHGHTWIADVHSRTRETKKCGCPYCGNRMVWPGFNDLASQFPEIAAQWHPIKNGKITPAQVVASSNKKYWWKCPVDNYEWEAQVCLRTGVRSSSGAPSPCPVCNNRVIISGINDLETLYPDIAAQWHPTKNAGILPSEVGTGTGKKYWWKCPHGHEWETSVVSRTKYKSGCPECND